MRAKHHPPGANGLSFENSLATAPGMKWLLPPLLGLTLLAGCTSPGYISIHPTVVTARRIVQPDVVFDVPFYQLGGPAQRYRVIGYVDEAWQKPYLEESDLKRMAKTIREAGGSAGVVVRGPGPLPGVAGDPAYGEFTLRMQIVDAVAPPTGPAQ